jgi:hypothetical protein
MAVGLRIVLVCALAALITAAVGAAAVLLLAVPDGGRPFAGVLQRGFSAHNTFQQERLQRLELAARLLAADSALAAGLVAAQAEPAEEAPARSRRVPEPAEQVTPEVLATLLRQRLPRVGGDVALLLGAGGELVARSDNPNPTPLPRPPLAPAGAGPAGDGGETLAGVWEDEGELYYAAQAPVTPDFTHRGWVVLGIAVDDVLALEIERAGGADAAFFAASEVGPRLVGASDRGLAGQLGAQVGGLGGPGGELARVLAGGGPVPAAEVTVGGRAHQALVAPLADAAGEPVGAVVLFTPAKEAGGGPGIGLALAGLGVGALLAIVVCAPLALAFGRSTGAAAGRLTAAVEAARAGELPQRTGGVRGPLAGLAGSLDRLLGDLHERQALAALAAASQRGGASAGPAPGEAEEERAVLLGADLRRFAGTAGGAADETIDRLRRDLRRFAAAVAAHGGRFEGALGHRALASFEGDGRASRALAAAARSLIAMATRDSAFDEGEPPALALAGGRIAAGRASLADGVRRVAVGTPLGLLDSLLREAQAGELVLAPPLARELEGELSSAGAAVTERPGVLSPRPLAVLDAAAAERLAGAAAPAPSPTSAAAPGRDPDATRFETTARKLARPAAEPAAGAAPAAGGADPGALGPGDAFGERFEVLEVLGAGPEGAVLRARDGELGEVVAVEALAPAAVSRPEVFTRLDSPLQSVRKLAHPSIARTYDYGRAGGIPFLAREHVPGTPVEKLLESPGRLPAPAALGLARQLAGALASAHRDGLAHGRLTPDRLILGADGRLKVTGFGLTGVLAAVPVPTSPGPVPPEGAGGPRGDVYAAAAHLYRLLLGAWPEADAAPTDGLPEGLAAVLAAALARDPSKRPEDAAALLAALDRVRA